MYTQPQAQAASTSTERQQASTLFNQVSASCTDTDHRRCTFITGSRSHPHSLSFLLVCSNLPASFVASQHPAAADGAVGVFFTLPLVALIGALKLAQQESMACPLSHSLGILLWWKNGRHCRSSIQKIYPKRSQNNHTLTHLLFLAYLASIVFRLWVSNCNCNKWQYFCRY